MNRNESREDYLEAILVLSLKQESVKSIDIANHLSFSKPSVSVAMKKLREENLIVMEKDGSIILTDEGRNIADKTYEKHRVLTNFFISLGVEPALAEDEACSIEHILTDDTFARFKKYLEDNRNK